VFGLRRGVGWAMTMRSFDSRYRRRRDARLTESQVLAAHRLYVAKGWSLRTLGAMLWKPLGYASAKSAANSLWAEFISAGLPRRDRIEATVRASTTHGLRPRLGQSAEQRAAYNERRRRNRERQDPCAAQSARAGGPCPHPSMTGSEFCFSHDPDTAELRDAILARARANGFGARPLESVIADVAGVDSL
jgi:hypothetical protein